MIKLILILFIILPIRAEELPVIGGQFDIKQISWTVATPGNYELARFKPAETYNITFSNYEVPVAWIDISSTAVKFYGDINDAAKLLIEHSIGLCDARIRKQNRKSIAKKEKKQ